MPPNPLVPLGLRPSLARRNDNARSRSNSALVLSRMPAEVLSQVFRHILHGDIWRSWENIDENHIPTKMDTPWPLMLVCRQWHEVVSSDAALWSTFILTIRQPVPTSDNVAHLPAVFEHCLRQSKKAPLTIKLALGRAASRPPQDDIDLVLRTFIALARMASTHCKRWQHVSLRVKAGSFYKMQKLAGLNLQFKRMPMLKSLEVDIFGGWAVGIVVVPHRALETLRFKGEVEASFDKRISQLELKAGFPSMREIRVQPPFKSSPFNFLWKIVKLSPSVVELGMNAMPWLHVDPATVPSLALKNLKFLRLLHPISFRDAIPNLSFPSLERLVLEGVNLDERFSRLLPDIPKAFGTSVTHLYLYFYRGADVPESSLVDMLRPMRCLVALTMSLRLCPDFGLPQTLLRALLCLFRQEQGVVVPRLELLHIDVDAFKVMQHYTPTLVRDLVVACHKTSLPESRHFMLQLDVKNKSIDERRTTEEFLRNGTVIKACLGGAFHIRVSSSEVRPTYI